MTPAYRAALVLAAHGDRGSAERNAVLKGHAGRLREQRLFAGVFFGVLNGEPDLRTALREAERASARNILVYPFFMSDGYFAAMKLPQRIAEARLVSPVRRLRPLGLDPAIAALLLQRSKEAAQQAGFDAAEAALLVVGHGSRHGRASAEATEAAARAMRSHSPFAAIETAFLEEEPFLAHALARAQKPTVVAGFFSGEGLHGRDDVGAAMARAAVPCVYTRPIGADPAVTALIEAAAVCALSDLPA